METLQNKVPEEKSPIRVGQRDRLSNALAACSILLAILTITITVRILFICYSPLPWGDTWDYWAWAQKYSQHPFWHLAAQHTEHRMPFGRLFLLFDQFVFAGTAKSLAVFIPLVQLAHATVLAYLISIIPSSKASTRWFLAAAAFAALFSLQQFANFTWYFQISFVAVYFGASLCCLTMLELVRRKKSDPKGSRVSIFWLLLTLLLAIGTSYSMANGLAIWLVLLSFAFFGNLSRKEQLILLMVGVVTCWAYLHGYVPRPEASTPTEALSHPLSFFRFFLVVLGNPFPDVFSALGGHVSVEVLCTLSAGVGLLGLFGIGLIIIVSRANARRDRARHSAAWSPVDIAIVHILLFVLLSAMLIATGRFRFFPLSEALSSRYTTPSLLFWLLLVVLLIVQCERSAGRRAGVVGNSLKGAVIVALTAFLLCNKPARSSYAQAYAGYLRESEVSIANNVFDLPKWKPIYYNLESMVTLADYLRANQLALFHRPWLEWRGDNIAKHYRITDRACRGVIDIATSVISKRPGYRLEGWASSAVSESGSMVIVLTDANGKIIGSGLGGVSRPDVALSLKEPSLTRLGWIGYVSGLEARKCVAYLMVGDRNEVCEVGFKDLGQNELR